MQLNYENCVALRVFYDFKLVIPSGITTRAAHCTTQYDL